MFPFKRFYLFLFLTLTFSNQCLASHFLFWESSDICDGVDISFRVNPFADENRKLLLSTDSTYPTLWYSPTDAIPEGDDIRIFYQRVEKGQANYIDQRTWCLGILSSTGAFILPDLRIYSESQIKPNNVVLQRSPHKPTWGGFNVFQLTKGLNGAFQLLYWDQPSKGDAGGMIAESTDGLHWQKVADTAFFTEHNDAYSLVYDSSQESYFLYQTRLQDWPDKPINDNLPGKRRVISLRQSKDLRHWSPQQDILIPDDQDGPCCEFYLLKAFRYIDRYVGFLMKYSADPSVPGKHSSIYRNELVMSTDGFTWSRPYRYSDIGVWTYVTPFVHNQKLCTVAYDPSGMMLCQARIDGLVACGSTRNASFLTPPLRLQSNGISLNADCSQGEISVVVVDENGIPFNGVNTPTIVFRNQDHITLKYEISEPDSKVLLRKQIRFRITVSNAWIYSLQTVAP